MIVFEGRDGAGKGGVIKQLPSRVSPRVFRVVALPGTKPSVRKARCILQADIMEQLSGGGRRW